MREIFDCCTIPVYLHISYGISISTGVFYGNPSVPRPSCPAEHGMAIASLGAQTQGDE